MFRIDDKNVLITGGASGIGLGVAERFVHAGASVVIADYADATRTADKIGAIYVRVDVSDETSVADAIATAVDRTGQLDVLINNAGIGDVGPLFGDTEQTLVERMTRINQWGVLYGLKHGPAQMNDGGSIINTASMAAFVNMIGSGVYSAGKSAVVSMTRMAALELGSRGIRVNAVCPAYIATGLGSGDEGIELAENFTALERVGTTDDVTGVFHFLAADESRYLTGQAICIDGGWSCGPTRRLLERVLGKGRVS